MIDRIEVMMSSAQRAHAHGQPPGAIRCTRQPAGRRTTRRCLLSKTASFPEPLTAQDVVEDAAPDLEDQLKKVGRHVRHEPALTHV